MRSGPDLFPPRRRRSNRWSRLLKWSGRLLTVLLLAILVGGVWFWFQLRRSLPQLEGERVLAGLRQPVVVHRDELGIATIQAKNRLDLAYALGFLHGQERFFQIDLLRRSAAGELSELFGPVALPLDRRIRVHRFRRVAERIQHELRGRQLVEVYAQGVNSGLRALDSRPFEYWLLRAKPRAFLPEDAVLVILAMYIDLQPNFGERESAVGLLHDVLPPELAEYWTTPGTAWDAPVVGTAIETPPIPSAEVFDLRKRQERAARGVSFDGEMRPYEPGSNNWAVGRNFTHDGRALMAGDAHLDINVPGVWYRAVFEYPDASGQQRRIVGATLPGTPAMTFGSNGFVAWSFTNSNVDHSDLVVLEHPDGDESLYLTPSGPRPFDTHIEWIAVRGAPDDSIVVRSTIWGPIIDRDHRGRLRALRWSAHDEHAVNFDLVRMESARDIHDAFAVANQSHVPAVNCVIADHLGNVGWTIAGPIPTRVGFDGRRPTTWSDGTRGWDGFRQPEEYPRLLNPNQGRVWTANARVGDETILEFLGDGGYAFGARAHHIRRELMNMEKVSARDMLRLQLDDRAFFLERWQSFLLGVLSPENIETRPRRQQMRHHVENWGGRAAINSVGYRLVRNYRYNLVDKILEMAAQDAFAADEQLRPWHLRNREGPAWRLLQEQPLHLLDHRYESWQALFLETVDETLDDMYAIGPNLEDRTWGERNRTGIRHPLSLALPILSRWLDMKPRSLPGDANLPRVQGPRHGASQRMVVSPGREEDGIFHMPCGQSGHPLSPFYRNGHQAWEEGHPTALLPGPSEYRLFLLPE